MTDPATIGRGTQLNETTFGAVDNGQVFAQENAIQKNNLANGRWCLPVDFFQDSQLYAMEESDILMRAEEGVEGFWFCSHKSNEERNSFISTLRSQLGENTEAPFVYRSLDSLSSKTGEITKSEEDDHEHYQSSHCFCFFHGVAGDLKPAGFAEVHFSYGVWLDGSVDIYATNMVEAVFLLQEYRGLGASQSIAAAIVHSLAIPWLYSIETYRKTNPDFNPNVNLTIELEAINKGGRSVAFWLQGEAETISDLNKLGAYDAGDLNICCYDNY
jgi:hypothetical protein